MIKKQEKIELKQLSWPLKTFVILGIITSIMLITSFTISMIVAMT